MIRFLTSGFGLQPPILHNPVSPVPLLSSPSHAPHLLLCLMLVLLNCETSRMQGSIFPSHFQFFLGSSGPFPSRALYMGVSDGLLPVCGPAGCCVPCQPCPLSPACWHFGLPGTTHQCPGKQWENSKEHVGALFFFLVLTTSGKNLDENRGAAGMIEEGFFCVVFFF